MRSLHLKNLSNREKISVAIAGVAIVLFIVLHFLVFPLMDKNKRLSRTLLARQLELAEIRELRETWNQTAEKTVRMKQQLASRSPEFSLFSVLEALAGKTGIKNQITYMKPSGTPVKDTGYRLSMVEMRLQEVTMGQLFTYLYGIETSPDMLVVKRLSITRGEQKTHLITAVFQVETLETDK